MHRAVRDTGTVGTAGTAAEADESAAERLDTDPAAGASAVDPLAGHRRRLRRARRWYATALTVLVVVLAVVVGRVWATSEIRHTTLHSASGTAEPWPLQVPAATLTQRWHTTDRLAAGTSVSTSGATVVTWSEHTVAGRDARTGAVRWSYTRTDRRLCAAVVAGDRAMALYAHDANCDEITALTADTGQRAWTRTLTDDGTPTLSASPFTVLLTTPAQVHAVDPVSGIDRWLYTEPAGCRTTSAVLGGSGTLIARRCGDRASLLLRDPYKGTDDKSGTVIWTRDAALVPLAADRVMAAFDPASGRIELLDATTGASRVTLPVAVPSDADTSSAGRSAAGTTELVWLAGTLYAIDGQSSALRWSARASAPATVTGPGAASSPDSLDAARITVPVEGGAAELDPSTGAVGTQWRLGGEASGLRAVVPVGAALVAGRDDGTGLWR